MKMRALVLASVASMIDQFNLTNIQLLQSIGYQVDVVADFTNPGNITNERAETLKFNLENKGSIVYDIAIPRTLNPRLIFQAYKKIKMLIDEGEYSLLHCHSPIGGAIARFAGREKRKKGLRIIYTAHGFHFYKGAPMKNWIIFYWAEKWLSRYTDVLITINKEDYKRAKENFKGGNCPETETIKGSRGGTSYSDIQIHSVRLPGYIASQEVIFGSAGQVFKVRHDTTDRKCYMQGVLMSVKHVFENKDFVYGLENILQ